jgi:hypothetical protein
MHRLGLGQSGCKPTIILFFKSYFFSIGVRRGKLWIHGRVWFARLHLLLFQQHLLLGLHVVQCFCQCKVLRFRGG